MLTERLLADATLDESSARDFSNANPHDSARLLLGLMTLHKRAEPASHSGGSPESLAGIISKGVLRSLMSALHFRDSATVRHSRRVALLSTGIAKHLGWESQQITLLEVAALLHDVGKIGVPDNILFKPGRLSPDEAELMDLHHNIGVDVLQACRVTQGSCEVHRPSRAPLPRLYRPNAPRRHQFLPGRANSGGSRRVRFAFDRQDLP